MVGFYLLAIAIVGVLFFIPYAEWAYGGRLHLRLALVCIVSGGIVLWSVVPRADRFVPPGVPLDSGEQPKLFEVLRDVANATRQAMPAQVYLVPDVNAWVANRGGIMGFGSRRVLGLGLGLLTTLKVAELRAVLAHEFGHYHGGDTKLGPWIYKTRAALGRTLVSLAKRNSLLQMLVELPFRLYGWLFLRVTAAISRRQELNADELALRTAGSQALVGGLRPSQRGALAFGPYWSSEVAPVLGAGFYPPLAKGFEHFISAAPVAESLTEPLEQQFASDPADPYDTHPPLAERIAAAEGNRERQQLDETPPALSLLSNVPDLEVRLLAHLGDETQIRSLQSLSWDEVGRQVYLPRWEKLVGQDSEFLAKETPSTLPERARDLAAWGAKLQEPEGAQIALDQRDRFAASTLGAALAVVLVQEGWLLHALPGELYLDRNGEKISPFEVVPRLAAGTLNPEAWQQQCVTAGIAALALAGDPAN
ncbi:MAG: hypothetical protein CL878_09980 [Dehalococcoidia bacterium]|nr:hypothetical protein [Dehalococcoidia bacterium]